MALSGLVIIMTGCDTSFEPFVDDPGFFSVSGYLDAGADTQFVRLNALRESIMISDTLGAIVRSTRSDTGEEELWQDSVVTLDNGRLGHLYFGLFSPQPGGTYRLRVTSPDIRPAEAVTVLPSTPKLETDEIVIISSTLGTGVAQYVYWEELSGTIERATVTYDVEHPGTGQRSNVVIDYTGTSASTPRGDIFLVHLERDFTDVPNALDIRFDEPAPVLHDVYMGLVVLSVDWGGEIQGGVGSFGSVIRPSDNWLPPPLAIDSAGFALADSMQ